MYRCTECYTEYDECPDFCDCGNDTFEEIADVVESYEEDDYEEPEVVKAAPKKRKLSPEELEELQNEEMEKKKSLIALAVIIVLCIGVFLAPPHKKKKMQAVKEKVAKQRIELPEVDSYWDSALPSKFKAKDPLANLPLLNERFRSISPVLREYLIDIGGEFDRKWDKSIVAGNGEAKVEFTIDKEGNISSKRIVTSSHNQSLDNSVLLALSNLTNFDVPPDDYKGERIYISFKVNKNGDSHVIYPMK